MTIIRLSGVTFGNTELPYLSAYGLIPSENLVALMKFDSGATPLLNKVTNASASLVTNASAPYQPSYASGVYTMPDAFTGEATYNQLTGIGSLSALASSFAFIYRMPTSRSAYLLSSAGGAAQGVNIFHNGSAWQAQFNNGSNRTQTMVTGTANAWSVCVCAFDSSGFRASLNAAPVTSGAYTGTAVPTSSPARAMIASHSVTGQHCHGEFAGLAMWDRALTNDEILAVAQGFKLFAASKGITV